MLLLPRATLWLGLLVAAARTASDSLPAGFWTSDHSVTASAPRKANGLPTDYSYTYSETPLPPPPAPPPPPPPHPPPPPASITLCSNTCPKAPKFASDSYCDDGGTDASFDNCDLGTDCSDCGPRTRLARVPAAPSPPPASSLGPPPPATIASGSAAGGNPFASGELYVSHERRQQLVIALNGTSAAARNARTGLLAAWNAPVGVWVEKKDDIRGLGISRGRAGTTPSTAEAVLRDAGSQSSPRPLVVFVLHALPNRDCHLAAPAGEICCHFASEEGNGIGVGAASEASSSASCDYRAGGDGTCEVGLAEYKADVVDALATLLAEYQEKVSIAVVIEPGALASLALGSSAPSCTSETTRHAYVTGVAYAIATLSARAPRVVLYLDAGDGGSLGWGERARTYVTQVARLGDVAHRLRGFATNVGGYQPLGEACPAQHAASLPTYCRAHPHEPCCATDPCGLLARFNSGVGELNYVQLLAKHFSIAMPGFAPRFMVDTSRNGVERSRVDCDHACNLRAAGFGPLPTADTALPETVDAYYWVHPPGVSDGCTRRVTTFPRARTCARPEPACARDDALGARPPEEMAPAAGELYVPLLRRLAAQADGDGAYEAATMASPPQMRNAQEAASFAAQVGVPAEWARGLPMPRQAEKAGPATDADGDGSRSRTMAFAALLAVVAVAAGAVLRQRGRAGMSSPQKRAQRIVSAQDDESELLSAGEIAVAEEHEALELAKDEHEGAEQMGPGAAAGMPTEFRCVD